MAIVGVAVAVPLVELATRSAGLGRGSAALVVGLLVLAVVLLALLSWYPCRSLPLGDGRAVVAHLLSAALATATVLGAGRLGAGLLARRPGWRGVDTLFTRVEVEVATAVFFVYLLAVAVHYLVLGARAARRAERRAYELRLSAREAELAALRAQIDPHFLFNSLGSISALVTSEPLEARRMCGRLADFLRRTLRVGSRDAVPLREELDLVDDYLSVEAVRFGDRLRFVRDVDRGAEACLVPPLILQPLVENAVRHGVGSRLEGGEVRLRARRGEHCLELEIENPVDDDAPRGGRGAGIGLENVRRRLEARYGAAALLRVGRDGDRFVARIELPAAEAEELSEARGEAA